MTKRDIVVYPTPDVFSRCLWIAFRAFRRYEDELRLQRATDRDLSAALGQKAERWMKVRSEEVYPVWYLTRHLKLSSDAEYRLTEPGAAADIELKADGVIRKLQITTAGPLWPAGAAHWGADHKLHMEQLSSVDESGGWGPYRRVADSQIVNRDEAICSDERDFAYLTGLVQTLQIKQKHQQSDCELIVYADAYDEAMSEEDFYRIALEAIRSVPIGGFSEVCILSATNGYYTKRNAAE